MELCKPLGFQEDIEKSQKGIVGRIRGVGHGVVGWQYWWEGE
jgi:hypothetical protein